MPILLTAAWPEVDTTSENPALPGQEEWCRLIPWLHRALANPAEAVPFPAFGREFPHDLACAYWEAAIYLMVRLMGWSDPGLGLQWWYRQGQPTLHDPRLILLKQIWTSNGQLDYLAAWAWTTGPAFIFTPSSAPRRRPEDFLGKEWWIAFDQRLRLTPREFDYDPYSGGSNPLHLGHSLVEGNTERRSLTLKSSAARRRAVLIVECARAWYPTLVQHGADLPSLGSRSWHVDVIVKPLGWLGTFRRSRVTGRWFQGPHSIHVAGNKRSSGITARSLAG